MNRRLSAAQGVTSKLFMLREYWQGKIAARRGNRLVILTYHRVLLNRDKLLPDEPTLAEFEWQMKYLSQNFNVISLQKALGYLKADSLPAKSVVITFDDGYRNNFDVAFPVLRKFNLPATFFVATGFLNGGCMWNDRIIEIIRRLTIDHLDLTDYQLLTYSLLNNTQKRVAIDSILGEAKYFSAEQRIQFVDSLETKFGFEAPHDMMMTDSQVSGIAQAGWEVGAHTVSHPILSKIDLTVAKKEIVESKKRLEAIIGNQVNSFAYPNGKPGVDYNRCHVNLIRETGYEAAVSTNPRFVDSASPVYELPRIGAHRPDLLRFRFNLFSAFAGD